MEYCGVYRTSISSNHKIFNYSDDKQNKDKPWWVNRWQSCQILRNRVRNFQLINGKRSFVPAKIPSSHYWLVYTVSYRNVWPCNLIAGSKPIWIHFSLLPVSRLPSERADVFASSLAWIQLDTSCELLDCTGLILLAVVNTFCFETLHFINTFCVNF